EAKLRRGAAFFARRTDDCVLLRTRPARGLLGGMAEVPTTAWLGDFDDSKALAEAPRFGASEKPVAWRKMAGGVRHVFTHFPLELTVYRAEVPRRAAAPAGIRWTAVAGVGNQGLSDLLPKDVTQGLRL